MAYAQISLEGQLLYALAGCFPYASFEARAKNGLLTLVTTDATGATHMFATPPGQDYRQHEFEWLLHRFIALIRPYYDAAERRGTLLAAPPES